MIPKNHKQEVKPYDRLAGFYDGLMAHVNYKQWTRYIKSFFDLSPNRVKVIADLSCGTGSHLPGLAGTDRLVVGSDLSLNMLRIAKRKINKKALYLVNADFKALPFASRKFDAAIALYDSVNYLLEDGEVLHFLAEAARFLKNDGLLIFDVVTLHTCKKYFRNFEESRFDQQGEGYQRKTWFDKKRSLQFNAFRIQHKRQVFYELHRQKIRTVRQWAKLVKHSAEWDYRVFGDFTLLPAKATSERVHFVCRKKKK